MSIKLLFGEETYLLETKLKRLKKDFTILDNKLIAHKGIYGYSNKHYC